MTVNRRAVLTWLAAGAAAVVSGCSRAASSPARHDAARTHSSPESPFASPAASPLTGNRSTNTASPSPTKPPAATGPVGVARQVVHGSRHGNDVALTFHGAGDPGIARDLLAIFREHDAHVTVLAVGSWLNRFPEMAADILAGGHELGNHTYHHLAIDELPTAVARREIVRCRDVLMHLTGSPGVHFRQSQAHFATTRIRRLAGAAGYATCLSYDVDSLDWTDPGVKAIRQNVQLARPGAVVSMHFGHRETVQAMPRILTDLADRGLRAVTARTLLAGR